MFIMTAKLDKRKLLIAAAAVIAAIVLLLALGAGESGEPSEPTASMTTAPAADTNDARVKFLTDFGWDVTTSPVESGQVKIPDEVSEVFDRYNKLQQGQGYDLSKFAGKNVMRYVYKINNYPGTTEPVYATLLVYKNQIIGGDITDTAAKGRIRGFRMDRGSDPGQPTQETTPETTGAAQAAA